MKQDFSTIVNKDLDTMTTLCVIILLPPQKGKECFANRYDYGNANSIPLQRKEQIDKEYFSLISHTINKHHNKRSIKKNSQYFKLCSSSESNTTVKESMHHMQLEKTGPKGRKTY